MYPVNTPLLPTWFEINTYGGRPVNTPVPPLNCVFLLPNTSTLKPNLGSHKICISGITAVFNFSPLAKVIAVTALFSNEVGSISIIAALKPNVNLMFFLNWYSS